MAMLRTDWRRRRGRREPANDIGRDNWIAIGAPALSIVEDARQAMRRRELRSAGSEALAVQLLTALVSGARGSAAGEKLARAASGRRQVSRRRCPFTLDLFE